MRALACEGNLRTRQEDHKDQRTQDHLELNEKDDKQG